MKITSNDMHLFVSGATFWRCQVKYSNSSDDPEVHTQVRMPVGKIFDWCGTFYMAPEENSYNRCFWRDLIGHSNSIVTFTTEAEASAFENAVRQEDLTVPYVESAIIQARLNFLNFEFLE
jgi:hypothetical protein